MSTIKPNMLLLEEAQESIPLITIKSIQSPEMQVDAGVENADGTITTFAIQINLRASGIRASKHPSETKLPCACYDRHIMPDSSFCLALEGHEGFTNSPQTLEGYKAWWLTLLGFLRLQNEANLTKRWRKNCDWKHSVEMVKIQQCVECWEAYLPNHIRSLILENKIELVPPDVNSEELVRFRFSNHHFNNSYEKEVALLLSLKKWLEATQHNWLCQRVKEGARCCGTLKHCELKSAQEQLYDYIDQQNNGRRKRALSTLEKSTTTF